MQVKSDLSISVPLPVSDKLAFPVISALGIVVCAARPRSPGAADRTRAVSLGVIASVSRFLAIVSSAS